MTHIYKLCPQALWQESEANGVFEGSGIDIQDGYIHFSTAAQVRETAAKHFPCMENLLLIAVDPQDLGDRLRYEPSRGGDLFPHLYGVLALDAVRWIKPLLLRPDGLHDFPDLES